MKRIAIQGELGSFHDIAAHQYFEGEQVQLICCSTFEQVFENIKQDPTVIGMTAIENTIAGSLLHNYELLRDSGAAVVGEHKLHISHCICCLPDDDWDSINEVHSHPVALQQCRGFLAAHSGLKAVEAEDTAGSAQYIAEHQCKGWAAICSVDAANMYGMKILEAHIEDNKHNFTRFLVLCHDSQADALRQDRHINKASLVFTLPHEEGSLSAILSVLSFYKLNLSKIQSLPIIGQEWQYMFYIDLSYSDGLRYHQAINAIQPLTREMQLLGEYEDGKQSI